MSKFIKSTFLLGKEIRIKIRPKWKYFKLITKCFWIKSSSISLSMINQFEIYTNLIKNRDYPNGFLLFYFLIVCLNSINFAVGFVQQMFLCSQTSFSFILSSRLLFCENVDKKEMAAENGSVREQKCVCVCVDVLLLIRTNARARASVLEEEQTI